MHFAFSMRKANGQEIWSVRCETLVVIPHPWRLTCVVGTQITGQPLWSYWWKRNCAQALSYSWWSYLPQDSYMAKKIGPVIVRIWHQLQNSANLIEFYNWCHILTITGPIFLAQNVTPLVFKSPNNSIILAFIFLMLWWFFKNIGY